MKKTLSLIISLIFIITCFTSCGPEPYGGDNERYDLVTIDGQDYLVIKDEIMPKIKEIEDNTYYHGDWILAAGDYDTVEEFVDTVKNGKLSDEDLARIKNLLENDSNGILICDFENIQATRVPDGYVLRDVYWNGELYEYYLYAPDPGNNSSCIYWVFDNRELYERNTVDTEAEYVENNSEYITEVKKVDNRTEYYCKGEKIKWKTVWYTITQGESVIQVQEKYKAIENDGDSSSEEVPEYIDLYGSKEGVYFYISITKPLEKPTVEWLSQFGIEDYKG